MYWCLFLWIVFHLNSETTPKNLPITVVNNGYQGVTIAISNKITENKALIDRLKVLFTDASSYLYKTTRNYLYFKHVTIVIPQSWPKSNDYETISGSPSSKAHVIIDNPNPALGNAPYAHGLKGCGISAEYIHLTPYLVLSRDGAGFGEHKRIILHEWGHFRWGLFDEYPTAEKPSESPPEQFYSDNGYWKPNTCSESIIGQNLKDCSDLRSICTLDSDGKPEKICQFCPYVPNFAKASIMGHQWLDSIVEFCDTDSSDTDKYIRHNSKAINNQNIYCEGKSAWEVMREHSDFKGLTQGLSTQDTTPEFRVVQEGEQTVLLVLDVSGSMRGKPLQQLRNAVSHFLLNVVENGTYVGIVTFTSVAKVVKDLTQITSGSVRQELVQSLPSSTGGGTSIGAGLQKGLETLKSHSNNVEGNIMYLVSDGKEVANPRIDDVKASIESAKVIVNTLAFGDKADEGMEALASVTGGSSFFYSGATNSTALVDTFTEYQGSGADSTVMIDSRSVQVTGGVPYSGEFYIDSDLNRDTLIQLIGQGVSDINITITSPTGQVLSPDIQTNANTDGKTVILNGNIQTGKYTYVISSSSSTSVILTIQAHAQTESSLYVSVRSSLSDTVFNYGPTTTLRLFVSVKRGTTAVLGADVSADIEDANGATIRLNLKDDGGGGDLISDDGIYTAVILPRYIQNGNRHSIKVHVLNTDQRAYIYVPSGETVQQVPNTPRKAVTTQRSLLDNFQRIWQAGEFKVTNYTGSVTADVIPPSKITTLELVSVNSNIFKIRWKAVGDDFDIDVASSYDVRTSTDFYLLRNNPERATRYTRSVPLPGQPGTWQMMEISLPSQQTTYLAIRALDSDNNIGPTSNILSLSMVTDSQWLPVVNSTSTDSTIIVMLVVISILLVIFVVGVVIVIQKLARNKSDIEKQKQVVEDREPQRQEQREVNRDIQKEQRRSWRKYERQVARAYQNYQRDMYNRDMYNQYYGGYWY